MLDPPLRQFLLIVGVVVGHAKQILNDVGTRTCHNAAEFFELVSEILETFHWIGALPPSQSNCSADLSEADLWWRLHCKFLIFLNSESSTLSLLSGLWQFSHHTCAGVLLWSNCLLGIKSTMCCADGRDHVALGREPL